MVGRPINPNSARQRRMRESQARQRIHGSRPKPKLATDGGRLVIPPGLIDAIQANARERRRTRADNPDINPFRFDPKQLHPPGSLPPKEVQMAMDAAIGWAGEQWANGGPLGQVFAEGLAFPGYPYLSELAQRPEYRTAAEITSTEMTRKWIKFSGKGTAHQQRQRDRKMAEDFGLPDPHQDEREADEEPDTSEKQEKIAQLEEFLDNLNCRGAYRLMEATDCYFGRAHLFHEINGNDGNTTDGRDELVNDIGIGTGDISRYSVSRDKPLTRLTNVEPLWIYPTTYNAMNPLVRDFYNPSIWYMQGIPVHCSRMFTQIGRPVPDLLKPAYSFGGLSLSQIMQPYVNIWLETRESIGRLIHAFSVMILFTDMQALMQPGGTGLLERINLFNTNRDNNGTFVVNKNSEDFKNVSVPLSGLHELQAQSQEHLCVQAGTLIETQRGAVPIEDVTLADMVLTRSNLAPLKWVGITGHVDSLIEIITDDAIIRVTQCHPIWSETTKQFVPAQSVRPFQRLLGLETLNRGNMDHLSHGAADGGGKPRKAITATRRAAACSIASFGRRTADLCRRSMTCITEMIMASTTLSTIWNLLRGPNITPAMFASASMSSIASTSRNVPNAAMTSLRSFPTKPNTVPAHAIPCLTDCAMDGSRSITSSNAASAKCGLNPSGVMRASALIDVASVLVKRVEVRGVERQPVYNLEVDGPPEFFANGILVHNCSVIRTPVAVYTGISPIGLNASSEGEIRIFENAIHAAQESRYRENLTKTVNFAQLSLWGEIDPDITFEFVQLRELTEKEEAELRKMDAETDDILINGCQALSPEEVRIRIAGDENGPHAGLDPDDMPEPPPGEGAPPGAEGEGQPGEQPAPGQPKPGGRINISGREAYTGVGEGADDQNPFGFTSDAAEWKEGDHPRAPDGKFGHGSGGGKSKEPLDVAKLTKIDEKLGSNEGGKYEDSEGRQFYIKKGKSPEHVKSEVLAAKLFRLAGGKTLKYERAGPEHVATRWEKVDKNNIGKFSEAERAQARSDFALHAWLANWDAAGLENDNYSSKGGQAFPNDLGGALEWRAQGSPKGDAFGDKAGEWDTMRDPKVNAQNAALFKGMTLEEMRRSALRVALVPDKDIRRAVKDIGKPSEMADKLIARKRDIEQRANGDPNDSQNPVTFDLGAAPPVKELNGIPFKAWEPPTDWADVDHDEIDGDDEMDLDPGGTGKPKKASTGVFMVEPDGRVWLMRPTGRFGGYDQTIPKGSAEKGLTLQQNAMKEVWEETGLKAKITGIAGDIEGDTSVTRYYVGEREAGDPTEHEWEASAVVLAPPHAITDYLNRSRDRTVSKYILDRWNIVEDELLAWFAMDEFEESNHPRDEGGKFAPKGSGSFGSSKPQKQEKKQSKKSMMFEDLTKGISPAVLKAKLGWKTLSKGAAQINFGKNIDTLPDGTWKFSDGEAAKPEPKPVAAPEPKSEPKPAPKAKAPQASPGDLEKAKKTTPFYYPDGVPASAEKVVKAYNDLYEGKTLTDVDALNQKVAAYKATKEVVDAAKAAAASLAEKDAAAQKAIQAEAQNKAQAAAKEALQKEKAAAAAKNKEVMDALGITEAEVTGFHALTEMLGGSAGKDLVQQFKNYAVEAADHNYPISGFQYALCKNYIDSGYKAVNRALRSGTITPAQHVYTRMVNDALEKMPKYAGTVTRGTQLTQAQIAAYVPGHIIEERAFTSTGVNFKFSGNVSYKIKAIGKRGGDFSKGANTHEREVLFKAHTFFMIHKVEQKGDMTHIEMEEVEHHG